MNGRVYDPHLGKMMSADPTIPGPFNSQAFNRYSYVLNNPLGLTDPSGFSPLGICSSSPRCRPNLDGGGGTDPTYLAVLGEATCDDDGCPPQGASVGNPRLGGPSITIQVGYNEDGSPNNVPIEGTFVDGNLVPSNVVATSNCLCLNVPLAIQLSAIAVGTLSGGAREILVGAALDYRLGSNGKVYIGWGGGSRAHVVTYSAIRGAAGLAVAAGLVGVAFDVYDFSTGEISGTHLLVNVGVMAVGVYGGPATFVASTTYTIADQYVRTSVPGGWSTVGVWTLNGLGTYMLGYPRPISDVLLHPMPFDPHP